MTTMIETTTYNGWTNYETWCVNLWLSNDEGLYNDVREMARQAVADDEPMHVLADQLKSFVDDLAEMTCPGSREGASFVTDLLGSALGSVDWHEIATNWTDDLA
jgi:hypothetical protein